MRKVVHTGHDSLATLWSTEFSMVLANPPFGKKQSLLFVNEEGDPDNRHERKELWSESTPDGRWRCYEYDELLKRDKLSLNLFWIKDKSLTDTDSLPPPDVLAAEIADDLEAALEQFTKIAAKLKSSTSP